MREVEEHANQWEELLPRLLKCASRKAEKNRKLLLEMWKDAQTLIRLIRAWLLGEYAAPTRMIVMAVAAVFYFVVPFDVIPDSVPLFGFFDDASVVAYVVGANIEEVRRFRNWEKKERLGRSEVQCRKCETRIRIVYDMRVREGFVAHETIACPNPKCCHMWMEHLPGRLVSFSRIV